MHEETSALQHEAVKGRDSSCRFVPLLPSRLHDVIFVSDCRSCHHARTSSLEIVALRGCSICRRLFGEHKRRLLAGASLNSGARPCACERFQR
jgi:hypothetical protein